MFSLAEVRKALGEAIAQAVPGVNVYAWPEPQPEYPCVRLGDLDTVTYHVATCAEGASIAWDIELMVANADIEQATQQLEALIDDTVGIIGIIEEIESAAWSNLVVAEARNFRRLESLDGYGCDLALTVHV